MTCKQSTERLIWYSEKKEENSDPDINEYKKLYRPCIQPWKFITTQTKKLKNVISQISTITKL